MSELDLTDWIIDLDKQIRNAKNNNEKSYKACKLCGDSGIKLFRSQSNNMHYLDMNYCECASGTNLAQRHIKKENTEK